MTVSPTVKYTAPFAVFVLAMSLHSVVAIPELADQVLRIGAPAAVILLVSRDILDFRITRAWATIVIGLLVFTVWVGPDLLSPGYRHHWLFENTLLGTAKSSMAVSARSDGLILTLRALRASIVVPIVEELFWRAWLMRWLISPRFTKVPLGTYQPMSFWLCAVLFASEHGSYWEVGLIAGVVYNWWMLRTRSLGDLILAHAITNACLSAFVIGAGKWEYWL